MLYTEEVDCYAAVVMTYSRLNYDIIQYVAPVRFRPVVIFVETIRKDRSWHGYVNVRAATTDLMTRNR